MPTSATDASTRGWREPHGWAKPGPEPWRTVPNAVTAGRTIGAVAVGVAALAQGSIPLLVVAYAIYWIGDILDGLIARWLDQETRRGAVADILCDRVCTLTLAGSLVVLTPQITAPIVLYLVQFAVVDLVASLAFLRYPILSPNYFHLVDRTTYRWNWSPAAKALNSATVVLVAGLLHAVDIALVLACAGLAVKLWTLVRLHRLPASAGARPAVPAPAGASARS